MSKIIIGIHGLGNKPPAEIMQRWWNQSLQDGFKSIQRPSAQVNLGLVYWADILHPEPLKISEKDEKDPLYLDEPYSRAGDISQEVDEPLRQKIRDYAKKQIDKLLLNEDLTINFSSITDFIIHRFFHDLEVYYMSGQPLSDHSALLPREVICQRLIDTLRQQRGNKILLIAHSMGSIIAYDVLSAGLADIQIDTLVTCGSPLGLPVIKHKIRAAHHLTSTAGPLAVPECISRQWINLSDLNDRVAIDFKLSDDYSPNSRAVAIRDIQVINTYEHNGEKNPHKAYGYLRTAEMAQIINDFIVEGRSAMQNWLMEKYHQLRFSKK